MGCSCNSKTKCSRHTLVSRVDKLVNKLSTLIVVTGDSDGEYSELKTELGQYKSVCIDRGLLVELENYVNNECSKYYNQ